MEVLAAGQLRTHGAHDQGRFTQLQTAVKRVADRVIMNDLGPLSTPNAVTRAALAAATDPEVERLLREGVNPNGPLNDEICGVSPMAEAARQGLDTILEQLLQANGDPDESCDDGRSLLHIAAQQRNEGCLNLLLERGATFLNICDDRGKTPWTYAAEAENEEIDKPCVTMLCEYGANPNTFDDQGYSALGRAVKDADFDAMETYITANADPSIGHRDMSTLHIAMQENESLGETLITKLLSFKADPNRKNSDGDTPLHIAVENDDESLIQELINGGADICLKDPLGQTPLMIAIKNKHENLYDLLIDFDTVRGSDNDGNLPLYVAIKRRDKELAEKLLEANTMALYDHNQDGDTAFTFLAKEELYAGKGNPVLTYIFNNETERNIRELPLGNGRTPVEDALDSKDYELLNHYVTELGIDPTDVFDERGNTLYHRAVEDEQREYVKEWLGYCQFINVANNEGVTPVALAIGMRDEELAQLMRDEI